jgi:HEAT repeat protein
MAQINRARLRSEILRYLNEQQNFEQVINTINQTAEFFSGVIGQIANELNGEESIKLNQLLSEPDLAPVIDRETEKIKVKNWHTRQKAATYLPYLSSPEKIVPLLINALGDQHDAVRLAAAYSLGKLHYARATLEIIHSLTSAPRIPLLRVVEVITMLGEHANPTLKDILRLASTTPEAKIIAIMCLGLSQAPGISQSVQSLSNDPDKNIRIQVAKALGHLADPSTYWTLIEGLRDKEWEVRAMSAQSLGRLTDATACHALEKHLGDPAYWVRYHCANALARFGNQGLDILKRNLKNQDPFICDICKQTIDIVELDTTTA